MDDLIHSGPDKSQAAKSIQEVDDVLATGSVKVKKWLCSTAIESYNETYQQEPESFGSHAPAAPMVNLDGEEESKTLGVTWNPKEDVIGFASREVKVKSFTKRSVLSNICKLYDPLGLASAVTIKARIALQNISKTKQFDWNDPLPDEMSNT